MIDFDKLERETSRLGLQYLEAHPFPHIVIDNFLLPEVAEQAYRQFPPLEKMDALKDIRQVKAQDPAIHKFEAVFQDIILKHLNSERFLRFVSNLTGIHNLFADPQLYAAGLAQGGNGSFLNVHIDNSSHPKQPWYRRVNILVYLNKHWTEQKGGHIEFWDEQMEKSTAILPVFNRAVLFTVSPQSWHGYRKVVTPDGDTRKSINLYYFTKESPTGEDYYNVTSFRARPGETFNRLIYPIDNKLRALYRALRPNKDAHAVLFEGKTEIEKKRAAKK